jgi:hypothetical protein
MKTDKNSPTNDTSRDAQRVQSESLRRLSPAERLALMDDLTRLAQSLTRAGIALRHPEMTDAQRDDEYARITLGRDLAARFLAHRSAYRSQQSS